MFSSVRKKNLNWKNWLKLKLKLKHGMGLDSLKILIFKGGGGGQEKPISREKLPKKGTWKVCLAWWGESKDGVVFLRVGRGW